MREFVAFIRQARARRDYRAVVEMVPYAGLLGMDFDEDEQGLLFRLAYREQNIGNSQVPALHGGVIAAFMEHSAILQLMWNLESTVLPKVVDFTIDYLRPGRPRDTFARCQVLRQGQRVANVTVEAWQDDPARLIAVARTHFLLSRDEA
ncbi:PaaI family thioesterase [Alkalilimnicola sp. S0819]|uniref:PaaI family thioesterase n=1 Tax=Alkalilimnicola sp. S0819 TaxID=2613922 RepID=UPI0012623B90|nr:PaaI family thioesterase [Alkalilimnicola sp. S0819]KAB7623704.1 PaaI family thioesterase [Alkalilimnicola sp. S0819]MPQ16833.1 hotdog fold thioesterase [Alkalilimnicola sp. S0819]